MLEALFHGKLSREQENMEDMLTSSVFGGLQFLPPTDGAMPFIWQSESIAGDRPLLNLAVGAIGYEFWPTWHFGDCYPCEPDVLLDCECPDGCRYLIAIEAKFHSPKSSEGDEALSRPYDQLAREWDNLVHLAATRNAQPVLVYLTADVAFPREDIQRSINDYVRNRGGNTAAPAILWLSWSVIPNIFESSRNPIVLALVRLMKRLGLVSFSGFSPVVPPTKIAWIFAPPEENRSSAKTWRWPVNPMPAALVWRFAT